MQLIGQEYTEHIVKNVSTCSADLLSDIAAVVAERDSSNNATESMPRVLTHQLAKTRGRDFADVILNERSRLSVRWFPQEIEFIEQEFQELCAAYEREPALKNVLERCDSRNSFEQGWDYVQQRFGYLEWFCGGLATAFTGPSTVESDLSLVRWEKDNFRTALTEFSLEGILHSKQFKKLQSI
ncbi:hypothetical protein PsorP6_005518 [Peronosclerospora sorghi]|uniref:Uncharacterized protein n=1 Tax=Peronosclerospora sorghi TaxID=230839 RepID=A0ACC0W614_9STRA|nr:hypothetical protein PsorP6_005518 [Peronosclerospora sorghi]